MESYDVVIVGGGAAGLSAAVTLGRSLRSVLVVDAGEPRNAPAEAAHMLLGREGVPPLQLLAEGRREAERYGASVVSDRAVSASGSLGAFTVSLASGTSVGGRRLLLATGLTDDLPEIPGLREQWGRGVIHCPFCHGYEVRGQRIAVLGTGPNSVHHALMFRSLSERVTFFRQDLDLDEVQWERLAGRGIAVVDGPVGRVVSTEGVVTAVVLADGRSFDADAVAVGPRFVANADLFEQLGGTLESNPMGTFVPTGMAGATAVPGVYAVGNTTDLGAGVALSAGMGGFVGGGIHGSLVIEEADAAAAARQAS